MATGCSWLEGTMGGGERDSSDRAPSAPATMSRLFIGRLPGSNSVISRSRYDDSPSTNFWTLPLGVRGSRLEK
jgi:hypothetical protein